jgi:hypothetical protein
MHVPLDKKPKPKDLHYPETSALETLIPWDTISFTPATREQD